MTIVLTPKCCSRMTAKKAWNEDAAVLDPYISCLALPEAQNLKVCSIIVSYKFIAGTCVYEDSPVVLAKGSDDQIIALDKSSYGNDLQHADDHATLLRKVAAKAHRPPLVLVEDFMEVTSNRLKLFIFPNLVIMQSDDIFADIYVSKSIYDDVRDSIWARSACARLRFTFPTSNHQKLGLVQAANNALETVKSYRSNAMRHLFDAGYDIGPITADSISADIQI